MDKTIAAFFWVIGLLCTITALALPIGNNGLVAIYNFLIPILFLYIIIHHYIANKPIIYFMPENKIINYFFIILIFSSLISGFYLPAIWQKNALVMTFKFCFFIGGFLVFFSKYEIVKYRGFFINGLYVATILQLIWGGLQLIFWELYSININKLIFGDLMHIGTGSIDWNQNIMGGIICRPSGFSWEPASFALLMIIGWLLAKSFYGKSLFILAILISTSRTGILTFSLIVILKFIFTLLRKKKNKITLTIKSVITLITFCGIIGIIFIEYSEVIYDFYDTISRTFDALMEGIMTTDNFSANVHKIYYLELFDLISQDNLWQFIFGWGTFCAGYPYHIMNIVPYMGVDTPWNPETDFITLLVGNGIIGVILYYSFLITVFKRQKKMNEKFIVLAILFSGITYLYIRGTWTLLLMVLLSYENVREDKREDKGESI